VLSFLDELRGRLAEVARLNGGVLSEDLVALVGGSEMQVPHVDLKPGQVQVIVALDDTLPTLVYDPEAEAPSAQEVVEAIGISPEHAGAPHLYPLFSGGSPLVLPAAQLYDRMVPACDSFLAGDAVQIRDGIVHAGPKCEGVTSLGVPRAVVFATYSPSSMKHYDVNFQYKLWDWASFAHVPAGVAYRRLYEVHQHAAAHGMEVEPWKHYAGRSLDACKKLCTTANLDGDSVELLVETWRSAGRLAGASGGGWVR